MNILLVEDDVLTIEGIAEFLIHLSYSVTTALDGLEALKCFERQEFDLIILDIMLPKISGLDVLQKIRAKSDVPVLMLTALNDEPTQIECFNELADDYMSKPFSLMILQKRIEALLRRNHPPREYWTYGNASVDFNGFQAWFDGKDAHIKPKEIQILKFLIEHEGQVLSREAIIDALWDISEAPYDRVIDVYIKNLRKKLNLDCIITVKGIGYKYEKPKAIS